MIKYIFLAGIIIILVLKIKKPVIDTAVPIIYTPDIIITGIIDDNTNYNKMFDTYINSNPEQLVILINSGGGYLHIGQLILTKLRILKFLNIKTICIVDGRAFSMALIIFSACQERLVVEGSKLMWHSVAITGKFTLNYYQLLAEAGRLDVLNSQLWHKTKQYFFPWYFNYHFKNETELTAEMVKENSYNYIKIIQPNQLNLVNEKVK